MARRAKGIFCLEVGEWFGTLKRKQSVEPILDLLNQSCRVPYIHRDIATETELLFYLRKWGQKKHEAYPVLYLAFHGRPGSILARHENGQVNEIDIERIIQALEDKCKRRIVHFGSCSVMALHGNKLNRYMETTGALALCGYSVDVPWLRSTALDLLFFEALQNQAMTRSGIQAAWRRIQRDCPRLIRDLHFRLVVKR